MAGLAGQYYDLIWRAVREGARVVEDVFGEDHRFERAYERASRSTPSAAHRFFIVSCYVARRILAEMLEALPDLPAACDVIASYSEEALRLAAMLRRDVKGEIAEYNIKEGMYMLTLSALRALEALARGVIGYCASQKLGKV